MPEPPPPSPDRARWGIALLLGTGVLVNYIDRVNLSVAVADLRHEFHLSDAAVGVLLSVYAWSYIALQVPSGPLLDRFGVKQVGRVSTLLWSIASLFTAVAGRMSTLVASRLLLGIAEAPTFPGNAKAVAAWFPREQRGLATAIFDSAAKFASAIGIPLVAWLTFRHGWRYSFFITAVLSFAFFLLFTFTYREPPQSFEHSGPRSSRPANLSYLLRRKKVWGVALGMAAYNYNFYLFLTWLPGYLNSELHLDILHAGFYTAVPWLAATASDLLVGGWLIDYLIARGHDSTRVRQAVLICGLVLGLAVIGATRTHSPKVAIAWISLALTGLAASAPVGWSIPGLIAPAHSTGRVGGIMNFAANLPAILAPIITGLIVGQTHSFTRAFLLAAVVLAAGIASYVFLLGRIEPVPEPT